MEADIIYMAKIFSCFTEKDYTTHVFQQMRLEVISKKQYQGSYYSSLGNFIGDLEASNINSLLKDYPTITGKSI